MNKFHKISLGVYLIIISVYELIFFNNFSGIDQIRHLAWVHYLRDSTHLLTIDFLTITSQFFMIIMVLFMNSSDMLIKILAIF